MTVCTDDVSDGFRARVGVVSRLPWVGTGRSEKGFFIAPGPASTALTGGSVRLRFEVDELGSTMPTVHTSSSPSDSLLVQPDDDELDPVSSTSETRSEVDVDVDEVVSALMVEYMWLEGLVCRRWAVDNRRAIPRTAEDKADAVEDPEDVETGREIATGR